MEDTRIASAPEAKEAKKNYLPGIDGLRAIAVVAVLLFHGGIATFGGGFLGVEVFFVVSGYLITLLMLRERESSGGIDVGAFWRRRARRLLPAAYALIGLVLLYALFAMPTELSRIRGDAVAALLYVINWTLIFADRPYFESMGRPSPLQHLWSLAVEEQFYLLWPIVLAGMLRFFRRREAALVVFLLAAGSYALMAWMYNPEADPARVYYGTDTRAGALLLGAGLAFFWDPQRMALKSWMPTVLAPIGPIVVAALIWVFIRTDASTPWLYPWGFVAASVATLATVFVATVPGANPLAVCLSVAPMRWLGTRSYGLYLWHWPIFSVTRPGLDVNFDGLDLLIGRLALTALAAEISFRLIEQPFRSGAVWRGARTLFAQRPLQARVLAAGGGLAALALVVSAFSAGGEGNAAASPGGFHGVVGIADVSVSSLPTAIPTVEPTATPTPTPEPTATPSPEPTEEVATSVPTPIPPTQAPPPPPPPPAAATVAPPPASTVGVFAVGDSVMLGAAPFMGVVGVVEVDAAVSRQASEVLRIIRERAAAGTLPPVVVVHTGNNGPLTISTADQIVQAAGGAKVIFVTVRLDRSWESTTNDTVRAMPGRFGNVGVADWREASGGHDEYFAADGIHLTRAGGEAYAAVVAWAVN